MVFAFFLDQTHKAVDTVYSEEFIKFPVAKMKPWGIVTVFFVEQT